MDTDEHGSDRRERDRSPLLLIRVHLCPSVAIPLLLPLEITRRRGYGNHDLPRPPAAVIPTETTMTGRRAWLLALLVAWACPELHAQTVEFNRDVRPILS